MDENRDHLRCRCPRLGGPISFRYCRSCGEDGQPCWKIFDCWWEIFDITGYLKENLSAEAFERLAHSRPMPKIRSLLELIEAAKKQMG